jgi:hypothetical protein
MTFNLRRVKYCSAECRNFAKFIECRHVVQSCIMLCIIIPNVIMLIVIMLIVVLLNVVMLNVMMSIILLSVVM